MIYTQSQWLLLFFTYCFLGWVWESCYVSVRSRRWVNRGFLYGPWLPIYGSGAVMILFVTLPVESNPALIFLFGMLSATLLEYITGAVMERLFHMRYWDYSSQPLNLNGHICLTSSLAWGGFSILLVRVLHPPIGRLMARIPAAFGEGFSLLLTILFVVDVTRSLQAALELKGLLIKLTESSQTLQNLEGHLAKVLEQLDTRSEAFTQKLQQTQAALELKRGQMLQTHQQRQRSRKEFLLDRLTAWRDRKSTLLSALCDQCEAALGEISMQLQQPELAEADRIRLKGTESLLTEFRRAAHRVEDEMAMRKNRDFQRAVSILERNPSAASRRYREAFAELRELKRKRSQDSEK